MKGLPLGVAGLLCLFSTVSAAASFDCSKAVTRSEHAICGDETLGTLDEQITLAYKTLFASATDPQQVKLQQRAWLKQRNACADTACNLTLMQARLQQLQALTAAPVQTPEQAPAQTPSAPQPAVAQAQPSSAPPVQQRGAVPQVEDKYLNMPYLQARALILADGWQPRNAKFEQPQGYFNEDVSKLIEDFRKNNLTEFGNCYAPSCNFIFANGPDWLELSVSDASESAEKATIKESISYNVKLFNEAYRARSKPVDPPVETVAQAPSLTVADCARYQPMALAFLMSANVGDGYFDAYSFLINNGRYTSQGYSLQDGYCYQTITVSGLYKGTQYDKTITGLVGGPRQ